MTALDRLDAIDALLTEHAAEAHQAHYATMQHVREVSYGALMHTQEQLRHEVAMLRLALNRMPAPPLVAAPTITRGM